MRIKDIKYEEFQNAARRGRTRSDETEQLIAVIDGLSRNQAKAILIGPDDTGPKIRSKLTYAAKLAKKTLHIAIQDDRVLFALGTRRRRRKS